MTRKRITSKYCRTCGLQFLGAIDPTGMFCTLKCCSAYVPGQPCPKVIPKPIKPFTCKFCGIHVPEPYGCKAHRKGKCKTKCGPKRIKKEPKAKKSVPQSAPFIGDVRFKKQSEQRVKTYGESFYSKPEWLELRYQVLKKYGKMCMLCGSKEGEAHVDHIKSRSKFPDLALVFENLQVLCKPCNMGKSNKDDTDWRVSSV